MSHKTSSFDDFFKNNHFSKDENYLFSACTIYNFKGEMVRGYAADLCSFEDDGSYLISDTSGDLIYKDKFNRPIWTLKNIYAHHGIQKDSNGDYLIISSDIQDVYGHKSRFDLFYRIARNDGKILAEYSLFKNFNQISDNDKPSRQDILPQNWFTDLKVPYEITHTNSFYQVDKPQNNPDQILQQYDFIINFQAKSIGKILVLDGENFTLKQKMRPYPYFIHDVQALENGSLLYLNNSPDSEVMRGEDILRLRTRTTGSSRVETMSLSSGVVQNYFDSNEPAPFLMHVAGSIQRFDDGTILTTDTSNKTSNFVFINKEQKVLKRIDITKYCPNGIGFVKLANLSQFLKNNIGL
ncbi:MAG: hypothetical protein H7177_10830 [Rhizobacter sp.]|nr:hypothetical protein [Bacteriovorax sp.]